jgi:hypothetical protein
VLQAIAMLESKSVAPEWESAAKATIAAKKAVKKAQHIVLVNASAWTRFVALKIEMQDSADRFKAVEEQRVRNQARQADSEYASGGASAHDKLPCSLVAFHVRIDKEFVSAFPIFINGCAPRYPSSSATAHPKLPDSLEAFTGSHDAQKDRSKTPQEAYSSTCFVGVLCYADADARAVRAIKRAPKGAIAQ